MNKRNKKPHSRGSRRASPRALGTWCSGAVVAATVAGCADPSAPTVESAQPPVTTEQPALSLAECNPPWHLMGTVQAAPVPQSEDAGR
jgi:hypothetical protein